MAKVAKKKAAEVSAVAAGGANPLEAQVTNHPPKLSDAELATFDFAVNVVKLNRAKAFVQQADPSLKGKEFVAAVKERYIVLGGLTTDQKLAGKAPSPKAKKNVVNLADEAAD